MNTEEFIPVQANTRTMVVTTYEYKPILGDLFGYWIERKVDRFGSDIVINIKNVEGNKVFVNGKEVK